MKRQVIIAITLTILLASFSALAFSLWEPQGGSEVRIVPDEYATIQAAVDAANSGDIIYVKPKTYYEHVSITKDDLTLVGEDKDTTIIDGSDTGTVVTVSDVDDFWIEGFTVRSGDKMGISLISSSNCTVFGNIVEASLWIGIEVRYCSDVDVRNNEVTDTHWGPSIIVSHCTNCNVSDNNIHDTHRDSIYLKYCTNCYITGNNITNSGEDGTMLAYSGQITIFHNAFIDNGQQTRLIVSHSSWNNTYPSGGNYWSDYNGEDKYSGPNQDQPGSDGIGDTPYIIDETNQDNYPLMGPSKETLVQYEKITSHGETYEVKVVCNATVIDFKVTPGSIQTTVSGTSGTTGYVGIVQPVGLNSTAIEVFLNDTKLTPPPYPEITTNGTHYFIYFAFTFTSKYEIAVAFAIPGDVNFDGVVDIYDAVTLSAASGATPEDPHWNPKCDLNDDLIIDVFDAVILSGHAGETWPV